MTVFRQKGEDFATQFHWMAMPSVGESALSFTLHSLEQPIDGRAMHRDCTASSGNLCRCSLLHLLDYLTPGCLTLFWGHVGLHQHHSLSFLLVPPGFSFVSSLRLLLSRYAHPSFFT
jgi:hypothetical protein